jgi:TP901 family phage tail tape measure protein
LAESLRELVVSLTLDAGSFTSQIKAANTAVKQAEANFKLAGAGVSGFGSSLAGAQAKAAMLTSKLQAQNQVITKTKASLDASKAALEKNQAQQVTLAQKIDATRKSYETEAAATGKSSASSQALAADLKKLEGQEKALQKQATGQAAAVKQGELALTNASAAAKETEAALRSANAEVAKASSLWTKLGAASASAQKALASAGQKLSSVGRKMTMGLTLPIVAAGTAALKASIDWEDAFAGVRKTVDGTAQQMKTLEDGIINMSKELPSSAVAIAQVAENAGQLGIKTDNILGFTRVMVDLGETTNLSADEAAIALAQFANITQMSQTDFDRLGATIVDLGNKYATTEADIVAMSTRLAGAGKQVKMSEANILAIAAAMASVGIEAEAGGSAMSKVMLNIDMAAAKGGGAISKYAKVAGMSAKDFAAAWKSDPAAALSSFVTGLSSIEAKGGNVALTLEKLGYTEVRTRDALLRLTGASGMLSSALGVADKAWDENSALTNEASKRYATNASKLKMLKNQVVATGISFGNAMTPHLEAAMGAITGIIDGFAKMDVGQQQMVISMLAVTAGIGPLLSGLGKIATGASTLLKVFSGPAGWIALAAAALIGLGIAINNVETPTKKLDKTLKGIKLEVDPEAAVGITAAINNGIDAAKKLHSITVSVTADTDKIKEQLEAAFADGKFTRAEYNAAKKFINDIVAKDIKLAKADLKLRVADFRKTLDGAIDEMGNPVFSEERKAELTAAVTAETTALITQLEGYKEDYNALLTEIYKGKDTPTQAEIDKLNELLAKITEIRIQLQAEQQQAILVAQMYAELALAGEGGPEATAQGIAFTKETADLTAEDMVAQLNTELAANQEIINAIRASGEDSAKIEAEVAAVQAASAAAIAATNADIAALGTQTQETIQTMIDALAAKYPAASAEIQRWATLWDQLNNLNKLEDTVGSISNLLFGKNKNGEPLTAEDYKSVLTPEVIAQLFSGTDLATMGVDAMFAAGMPLAQYVIAMQTKLAEAFAKPPDNVAMSPLVTLMNALVATGNLDGLDITKLDGFILSFLKLANLKEVGLDVGSDVVGGILGGTIDAASELTAEELAALATYVVDAINGAFGIESPATVMKPTGRSITAGLAAGVLEAVDEFTAAIAALYAAGTAEADRQEIILRNHLAWLASTRPGAGGDTGGGGGPVTESRTYNDTVNINANITNPSDVAVLAAQLDGRLRRISMGYGSA